MSKFIDAEGGTIALSPTTHKSLDRLITWLNIALSSTLTRQLLFVAATATVVLLSGYDFGTYDQAIHIPFLKKFADASLYPGDLFMDLRFQHFSFFWLLLVPAYKLGILEVTMFLLYLITTYLTFWGIWTLSETLFQNRLASILSVILMIFPHIPFGGWVIFEFSLLNRTFVMPFLLFSITLYLKRRYVLAFALLGLMYNLHALSANFVLAMFLFDTLLQWRKLGIRTLVLAFGAFLLTALPVLAWKLSVPADTLELNPAWLDIIGRGMMSNTYFMFAPLPYIWMMTASGITGVLLYVIARHSSSPVRQNRTITNFMLALVLLLVLQVVTVQWFPVTILIEAQLIRAGVWVMLLSYLCFSYYIAELIQTHAKHKMDPTTLTLASLFPLSFVPVLAWLFQRFCAAPRWRWLVTVSMVGASFGVSSLFASALTVWDPTIHIYARSTPWYDVQIWARDNTPRSTVFITPSDPWSFHESDWRVFSERSTVVTLPELNEIAFAPDYLDTWKERFQTIYPGALAALDGNTFTRSQILRDSYYSLSEQDIVRAACQYGVSYLVSEKPHHYTFSPVYQNEAYIVYAIPLQNCDAPQSLPASPDARQAQIGLFRDLAHSGGAPIRLGGFLNSFARFEKFPRANLAVFGVSRSGNGGRVASQLL